MPGIHFDRITFDELAEDFLRDYRLNQRKSLDRTELSIKHLKGSFGGMQVPEITTAQIEKYTEDRLDDGVAPATVNRELAALRRALIMGARQTPPKVSSPPYVPMLKEHNTRKGFFEHGDFLAIRKALPEYLKGYVTFAYNFGWRKDEISSLTWSQVDRENWIVSLNPGETKNDEARTVYLKGEVKEVFKAQWEARKKSRILTPYVFPNWDGTGKIKDFAKAWRTACKDSRIGAKLFHDFRRTACRNMIRAGIPERVAMTISGHKTRSVFDRYNIVNDADLKEAAQRQEEYINSQTTAKTATISDFRQVDEKRESTHNG